ncbi:MAG: hypothetical protein ABI954_12870 [Pyrinomonadaceae bacterium]
MDKEAQKEIIEGDKDESTWAHDQKIHDYYYDDAHGYEIYDPDQEEDDDDEELLNANS